MMPKRRRGLSQAFGVPGSTIHTGLFGTRKPRINRDLFNVNSNRHVLNLKVFWEECKLCTTCGESGVVRTFDPRDDFKTCPTCGGASVQYRGIVLRALIRAQKAALAAK